MIVAIHQPEHLPWLGFFEKMKRADIFVLLDDVQFSKGDFHNRTRIKGHGGPQWLTVPVIHKFPQKISEVRISPTNWRSKHRKSIHSCYAKSKYFGDFIGVFEELYDQQWETLLDFNIAALDLVRHILGLKNNWIFSSSLQVTGQKSDLVLNICKRLGAHAYYSGRTGSSYLNRHDFEEAGIEIAVQSFMQPGYEQRFSNAIGLLSNLSVIDALFNCGVQSRKFLN